MDLAKIRRKYRQPLQKDTFALFQPDVQTSAHDLILPVPEVTASVAPEVHFHNNYFPITPEQVSTSSTYPEKTLPYRDPIETILAGRKAAGCCEESNHDEELFLATSGTCYEYLCFRVSNENYGINIMDIKEIIKPRQVTEIPRSPEFVSGVISLRGIIIPVINMSARLGLPQNSLSSKERVVVIKNDQSFSGLLVDEVIQVLRIYSDNVEPAPSVLEGIDRDFVTGIGRSEGKLVIILNLKSIADINLY